MPAFYAHYRFGAKVFDQISGELKETLKQHHPQFVTGLQGPDIFFFYRPYCLNKVSKYGFRLHKISAYPFFEHARLVIREKGRDSAEYAYLMGVICHFVLDSECHPYVGQMMEELKVQHLEIEEEFEKALLRLDGKEACRYPLARLVPVDDKTARSATPFYEKVTQEEIRRALKDMKMVKRLFYAPGAFKYTVLDILMRLTGKYKKVKGLMIQRKDNPACRKSSEGLMLRFDRAVKLAVRMLYSFDEGIQKGGALERRFDRTFD